MGSNAESGASAARPGQRGEHVPIHELSPYPLIELADDGTVVAANSAARKRFPNVAKVVGERGHRKENLGRIPFGHLNLSAWVAGSLYPVRFDWMPKDGAHETFIAIPFSSEFAGAKIAVLLVPAQAPASEKSNSSRASAASAVPEAAGAVDVRLAKQIASLTQRERQIVVQILAGSRSTLIAEDLEISVNTVRNHLKSIFRKLGVRSQEQLVRVLRRAGA